MIVGLGNPGTRYERTRHNAGFMVVDALAGASQAQEAVQQLISLPPGTAGVPPARSVNKHGLISCLQDEAGETPAVPGISCRMASQGWTMRCQASVAEAVIVGQHVMLAKPATFMNASGQAVRLLLDECGLDWKDLIVVLDDLDLPLGRIRIRERGSAGGHHGVESIIRMLGSDEFIRVRLGIGEENMPVEKAEFVLSEVLPGRAAEWDEMIARAAGAVQSVVADGVSRAMSMFNA